MPLSGQTGGTSSTVGTSLLLVKMWENLPGKFYGLLYFILCTEENLHVHYTSPCVQFLLTLSELNEYKFDD